MSLLSSNNAGISKTYNKSAFNKFISEEKPFQAIFYIIYVKFNKSTSYLFTLDNKSKKHKYLLKNKILNNKKITTFDDWCHFWRDAFEKESLYYNNTKKYAQNCYVVNNDDLFAS